MLKKIYIFNILLTIVIILSSICYADDRLEVLNEKELSKVIETSAKINEIPSINSRYAVVIDRNTNKILYGKNEKQKTKMASTTKIMTALIVIENTNLDNIVEISAKAAGTGGSKLKLKKGDKVSVNDLLYGLMLRSGNDAAVALAEYISGDIQEFAKLMNQKAEELKLTNTHFETPHGLDSDNHYTTPYELAKLTNYALNNPVIAKIVNTKNCTITVNGIKKEISNTNELLGNLNGVYGVKTGFTNGAGRCLVTSIKRDNMDIICVVLGADTKRYRTSDSIKLIEYTFKNFHNIDLKSIIEEEFEEWSKINLKRFNIIKGIKSSIKIRLGEYNLTTYPVEKGREEDIYTDVECKLTINSPIKKGDILGKLIVYEKNNAVDEINIISDEDIAKKSIKDYILEITKEYNTSWKNITRINI